jgi:hypothetical protein
MTKSDNKAHKKSDMIITNQKSPSGLAMIVFKVAEIPAPLPLLENS